MKYLILISLLLTGCATINQDIVTTKDGITQKCKLAAKGFIGSAESIMTCRSYDESGNYIDGSESVTKTIIGG
jgi:starvation-inducible outer membrane lipoprotein